MITLKARPRTPSMDDSSGEPSLTSAISLFALRSFTAAASSQIVRFIDESSDPNHRFDGPMSLDITFSRVMVRGVDLTYPAAARESFSLPLKCSLNFASFGDITTWQYGRKLFLL